MEAINVANLGLQFGLVEINATFFFQIFNTLVLFAFLRWKLFGPVSEFMQKRTDKIKASLEEAENKHRDVDAIKADYEGRLANIHNEELAIIKEARLVAEKRAADIIRHAEKDIVTLKEQAQKEIEREREKAINQLKDDIASLAILAASKVIDAEVDSVKHSAMLSEFIERVGDARWHN
ncbi:MULTISPECIES: F0F1 ATP synthase subunit B [unclassified Fusibacter]|uniref:F0F1 ATP synthase subunit B n=1 Tax=unclassified Fusibacter TaxID=2624464 RepID=UPI0013E97251|nr:MULTISPECIES: F0F1 ATP synthase subunit B [unclassified Fusibacter]MCK8059862.1 F0F1 ATP synthase subunit B [Fusibacter sp. A2]NPE21664.1 F0F1 ATP synthase subunit B [Fusibacter sp. A1]